MQRLRLDNRWRDVFRFPNVDATLKLAVPHAVQKINQESDGKPGHKTKPSQYRQAQHKSQAHEHADYWKNRNERYAKRTRSFWINAAQYVHAETNQNECKERADVREVCELA